jgi:hypothetical protein
MSMPFDCPVRTSSANLARSKTEMPSSTFYKLETETKLDTLFVSSTTRLGIKLRTLAQPTHLEAIPHAPTAIRRLRMEPCSLQLAHSPAGRIVHLSQRQDGPDNDAEAHVASRRGVDQRRDAAGHHVEQAGHGGQLGADAARELEIVHALEEGDVGAGVARGAQAGERVVEAVALQRVGAGDQDEVAAGGGARHDGGADARHERLDGDELLALEVAAALGDGLILQVERRHVGVDVCMNGARDAERTAEASVGVGDDGDPVVQRGDHARLVGHLGQGDESQIRGAQKRGSCASAGLRRVSMEVLAAG